MVYASVDYVISWQEVYGSNLRNLFDRHIVAVFFEKIRKIYGSVTVTCVKNCQITKIRDRVYRTNSVI